MPDESLDDGEQHEPKPCGEIHPLPCGLDKDCPVPVEYHDVELGDQEIVDEWGRD